MRRQIRRRGELPIAHVTRVGLFPRMYPNVDLQTRGLCEFLAANETGVRLLARVRSHVLLQVLVSGELPVADRARRQVLPRVGPGVLVQVGRRRELLIARYTCEFFPGMLHHVRLQLRGVVADLVTHSALVGLLARVFPHVHGQLGRMCELGITDLAADLLSSVLAHMNIQV